MNIFKATTKQETSEAAAHVASRKLREAIDANGQTSFIVATGASQFDFLAALTADKTIDWDNTTMFHLDEYIGIPETHPASFRKYLRERLVDIVQPGTVHFLDGEAGEPQAECDRLNRIISQHQIDVAFVGIGENGHLAFNDPPADFETEDPYILVELDEACRLQQVGEGWFTGLDEVPTQAISMSIRQIMKAQTIICTVPDERKAEAVRNCLHGEITPMHPASILQTHPDCTVFLDAGSASLLSD
ncbi:glucosamine-6-phosphate deaminase [Candidatus Poribacteria bacterium]|nr:glucosamine-6-phosphate deaminase [Candidatus Poribacteria bacterium]MYA72630.1 glucosamine-6-phosphate deaminase [Candidatus Poribacteria bacterium]MYH81364.1 glucosamine-6-phosphate deaminase [Candidatus Poribacteria bacterium]MYK94396.1 glucosamine-6-phosphate deaminase [Candidatus Poribacteria bacterium]